jgi:hypothetical protein
MKVALLFVCLNPRYWPFLKNISEDVDKHFLKNHQVDKFVWTDVPEIGSKEYDAVLAGLNPAENIAARIRELNALLPTAADPQAVNLEMLATQKLDSRESIDEAIKFLREKNNFTIIPTGPSEWPLPTLMRYHLFLQEEEKLKEYDYIFYLDADMRMVGTVGDEILGNGLTMAQHPMYALARRYIPPYEPNPNSTAFIPRFGRIQASQGTPYFDPLYAAGGFQGGRSADFITAMWAMKRNIDKDFHNINYTAIWNDESHWNKYLSEHPPVVVLDPGYIYPDSLINEYYIPTWGRNYEPKIITLTKKFSLSPQGMDALKKMVGPVTDSPFICPTCGSSIVDPKIRVTKVNKCGGSGGPHEVEGVLI